MQYYLWETDYTTLWGKFLFSIPFMLGSLLGAFLFSQGMERRSWFWMRAVICFLLCSALAFVVWPAASKTGKTTALVSAYLLFFAVVVVSMLFCYRCTFWNAVFYSENGVAAFCVVKLLFDCVGILVMEFSVPIEPYGFVYSVLYVSLGAGVYALFYVMFSRHMEYKDKTTIGRRLLILPTSVILFISTIFNINIGKFIYLYHLGADILLMLKAMLILSCFLALGINFGLFTIGKQQYEMDTIRQLNKQKMEQLAVSKANIEDINIKYHDLKGMVSTLQKMANNPQLGESLNHLQSEIACYENIAKTGNEYLDVILTEKSLYCKKNQIKFSYQIEGEKLSFMETMDLISLFQNLTSNAIEAVLKLKDVEKRIIALSVIEHEHFLCIHCDNYFDGTLQRKGNGYLTTKSDVRNHGYGLKSIGLIVDKYGGKFTVRTEGELFHVNLILPVMRSAA